MAKSTKSEKKNIGDEAKETKITEEIKEEEKADTNDSSKTEEGGENSEEAANEAALNENDKIADLEDRLKRQMAEFENFRKRNEKEKTAMFDAGAVAILDKILPVIDNFERGLESADDSAFSQGMQMIYKQLKTSLDEIGLKEIEALGASFDPNFHNAVMHEDDENAGENEITAVMQKGYMYHDSVIRFSMVKVAN